MPLVGIGRRRFVEDAHRVEQHLDLGVQPRNLLAGEVIGLEFVVEAEQCSRLQRPSSALAICSVLACIR
jgi:hypothetical protein